MNQLKYSEYPDCCGIDVLCNFPLNSEDDDWNYWSELSVEERETLKKGILQDLKDSIKDQGQGMLQVVLNSWQNRKFGALVRQSGYKLKTSFLNPNSGNKCYFYLRLINQPSKGKKVKKVFS